MLDFTNVSIFLATTYLRNSMVPEPEGLSLYSQETATSPNPMSTESTLSPPPSPANVS
jgi:hypothetical protein